MEGKQKQQAVKDWLEQVVGETLDDNLEEAIRDGTVLCRAINGLHSNAIKKFHKSPKMPAMCMENLGTFFIHSLIFNYAPLRFILLFVFSRTCSSTPLYSLPKQMLIHEQRHSSSPVPHSTEFHKPRSSTLLTCTMAKTWQKWLACSSTCPRKLLHLCLRDKSWNRPTSTPGTNMIPSQNTDSWLMKLIVLAVAQLCTSLFVGHATTISFFVFYAFGSPWNTLQWTHIRGETQPTTIPMGLPPGR